MSMSMSMHTWVILFAARPLSIHELHGLVHVGRVGRSGSHCDGVLQVEAEHAQRCALCLLAGELERIAVPYHYRALELELTANVKVHLAADLPQSDRVAVSVDEVHVARLGCEGYGERIGQLWEAGATSRRTAERVNETTSRRWRAGLSRSGVIAAKRVGQLWKLRAIAAKRVRETTSRRYCLSNWGRRRRRRGRRWGRRRWWWGGRRGGW
mmetsp:Transcript_26658/g.63038  ORF Transcript_26658/g.63038 Transcript_26658/m.63038 type:complete len:211 (+) Transcript_26658:199-831(+)